MASALSLARNVLSRTVIQLNIRSSSRHVTIPAISSSYVNNSYSVGHSSSLSSSSLYQRWFASYPPHEIVGMPSLSPTMESGTISSWNIKEGSSFAAGDVLCSVETDKATVDFEAQDEGVVAKIIVPAGAGEIPCGNPIMVTVQDEADVPAFKDFVVTVGSSEAATVTAAVATSSPPPPTPVAAAPSTPTMTTVPTPTTTTGVHVFASPRAHTLAKQMGYGEISALRIVGTGPGGRIIAQDVLEYNPSAAAEMSQVVLSAAAAPSPVAAAAAVATTPTVLPLPPPVTGAGYTDYTLPALALELASRLHASKQNVPHYYLTIDLTLDSLLDMRSTLNSTMKIGEGEGGITVNDLLMKAAAAAMKTVPAANSSWMGSFVRVYDSVDINVVVGNGSNIYSPVIRDVGRKGLKAVSDDVATATSVVEGGVEGSDPTTVPGFGDVGTFTMVNLGMYGVKSCAPIIREPQACALALGVIENRIVPNDVDKSEEIYKESVMMTATLSCDHRVVDGAVGAQWLSAFKKHVENPVTLLL